MGGSANDACGSQLVCLGMAAYMSGLDILPCRISWKLGTLFKVLLTEFNMNQTIPGVPVKGKVVIKTWSEVKSYGARTSLATTFCSEPH